jgi:hypothetical protein
MELRVLVLAPGGPASFRGLFAGVEEEQPMVVIQINGGGGRRFWSF